MAVRRLDPTRAPGRAPGLPVAAALLGIALFSVMDALMKRASLTTGVFPALFGRSVVGMVLMAPVWWIVTGGRVPQRPVLRLHLLRGALVAGMAGTFFYGVVRTPLALGISLSFIAPLLALGLASLILGESIRRRAIGAALLALAGVAVTAWGRLGTAPPSGEAVSGLVAVLGSAVLYAWNLVIQRQQAQLASPVEVALAQNVVIGLVLVLVAPVVAAGAVLAGGGHGETGLPAIAALLMPLRAAWPDIACAALVASISLILLSWAYARAEAQALVPLEYTAFLWAALMGWWWFGEVVTGWTLAGLVLILAGVWQATRTEGKDHLTI